MQLTKRGGKAMKISSYVELRREYEPSVACNVWRHILEALQIE